jgi:Tfp pilus assembly protein PilF
MPHNNLGVLYNSQKKYALAEKEYKEALHLEPGNALAHNNLERLRKMMEKETGG